MRVSEAHQLKDGSQATASDPQFGKTVKDMPRYKHITMSNNHEEKQNPSTEI